jgi:hypothetical protein
MQNPFYIILNAILATTLMTAFSYGLSYALKKQFKEPELLNKILSRLHVIGSSKVEINPLGWFIHYTVGIIFILFYEVLWESTSYTPTLGNFMFVGALLGVLAIVVWAIVLKIHPRPPKVDYPWYYIQLFVAHTVFGIGAFLGRVSFS